MSDDESQFGERVGQTKGRTDIGPEIVEAPAEVLNEGVRGDDDPGGTVSLQPAYRSKSSLQASVVGLKRGILPRTLKAVQRGISTRIARDDIVELTRRTSSEQDMSFREGSGISAARTTRTIPDDGDSELLDT
ncbi:MAG TPA: hypothetical protein VGS09_11775 [Actinomycetota bacterium]|nr:hypothetical protein [Actinomycetota bacterium]